MSTLERRAGGDKIPEAEYLQRAWADVGENLNHVERLRGRLVEAASVVTRSDLG